MVIWWEQEKKEGKMIHKLAYSAAYLSMLEKLMHPFVNELPEKQYVFWDAANSDCT